MLQLSLQKIWNKKLINLCLILGIVLMVGTLVSFPLYEEAAYDRMLQDEFKEYLTNDGKWPTMNEVSIYSSKDKKGKNLKNMEKLVGKLDKKLGLEATSQTRYYSHVSYEMSSELNRPDLNGITLRLSMLDDIESHINILYGDTYSATGKTQDGAIEILIDESCMIEKGLLLGETVVIDALKDKNGNPVRLFVCGIFDRNNNEDMFWQVPDADMLTLGFARSDVFTDEFLGDNIGKYTMTCTMYQMYDYKDISYDQVDYLYSRTRYYLEKSKYKSIFKKPAYYGILQKYMSKQTRISGTLKVLLIPIMILLVAFLFMISKQMYAMEQNEISVIKSRGSFRRQILGIYMHQNICLTLVGGMLGILLGRAFASVLGSTRNFLQFSSEDMLSISMDLKGYIYAFIGMAFCLIVLTLPSVSYSKVSIVHVKQKKAAKNKALWQKLYLDFILLGIAIYGFYSFNNKLSEINEAVLSGNTLDPLLYICSSLFILGAGLLYLRLQPLLVSLIYLIGRKKWGPSGYISFMENKKNGGRQQAVMLFLIMTISLGMYHAVVARTILNNALDNRQYLDGADVIIKEKWEAIRNQDGIPTGEYIEPDFQKYLTADFSDKATRVYFDDLGYTSGGKSGRIYTTIMGIHTREFGELTSLSDGLNPNSYYSYLNELALEADGLLVSSNFASTYGYEIGDTISFNSAEGKPASGKIVDFVDYWPGYASTVTTIDAEGNAHTEDSMLIVTHYELLHKAWKNVPYEVWISLKDGALSSDVSSFIQDQKLSVRKYVNKAEDINGVLADPLLQGTNGVLTMGFVVTIILCIVGYLIYWIMSVRERELVFGVLRACGFHKEELLGMLMNEQLFSGVLSCVAGVIIGAATSRLYVPILQYAYASADQTIPMTMSVNTMDIARLMGVIILAMVICLVVLVRILRSMNITKALKLGEE